jgi:hypothetical protein
VGTLGSRVCGVRRVLLRHGRLWLLAGMLPAVLGCAPRAEVRLFQPAYLGAERDLHLTSDEVYWAPGEGVDRLLAEFPLPGAVAGRPTYLLYLRIPSTGSGTPDERNEPKPVRGFLIQTQGRNAGLEMVVGGRVAVTGSSQAADATRQLDLEVTCEHGTTCSGHLIARRNDAYLHSFETRRRPADVQALDQPDPAGPGQPLGEGAP